MYQSFPADGVIAYLLNKVGNFFNALFAFGTPQSHTKKAAICFFAKLIPSLTHVKNPLHTLQYKLTKYYINNVQTYNKL